LIVNVKPSQAKTEGAMFKLDDGEWQSPTVGEKGGKGDVYDFMLFFEIFSLLPIKA